jgi:folate-binding protein YgfZ
VTLTELVASRAQGTGEYHGVSTAVGFGDPVAEWEALDRGAALLDRSFRRSIVASGEDRSRFLQGQLSSQVECLSAGDGQAALLLNAQGRVQSILALYDRGDAFHLVVDADLLAASTERLEQFLVADDVEFEPPAESAAIQLALAGPEAEALLSKVGVNVPASPWGVTDARIENTDVVVYARGDLRVPVYELAGGDATGLWTTFEGLGAIPCGFQAVETVRLESGTARFGVDVGPDRIAVEGRLEWAIHFAKGCYVGQEVIERAVSRGRINRVLCLLELEGVAALGAPIEGAGPHDVVTSLARSPKYGYVALAYVDRDRAVAGVRLHVGGVPARVLEWPRREILAGR